MITEAFYHLDSFGGGMLDSCVTVKSKENLETFYKVLKDNFDPECVKMIKSGYYSKIVFDNKIAESATYIISDILVRCYAIFFITCLTDEDFSNISNDDFYRLLDFFARKVAEEDLNKEIEDTNYLLNNFSEKFHEISIDGFFVFCLRKFQKRFIELYNEYLFDFFEELE